LFYSQATWYQLAATHWITSAKKEETRERRLDTLIAGDELARRLEALGRK
jgi:hypothetical protein